MERFLLCFKLSKGVFQVGTDHPSGTGTVSSQNLGSEGETEAER